MPGSTGNKVNYEFHPDGYIISTGPAGVEIELEDAIQLFDAARSRYQAPFGLVSNRIHDFSLAFSVYEYIEASADLVALAVVLYDKVGFPAAKLENALPEADRLRHLLRPRPGAGLDARAPGRTWRAAPPLSAAAPARRP